MTAEKKIAQKRLTLLQVAERIRNVSEACRPKHIGSINLARKGAPEPAAMIDPVSLPVELVRCFMEIGIRAADR